MKELVPLLQEQQARSRTKMRGFDPIAILWTVTNRHLTSWRSEDNQTYGSSDPAGKGLEVYLYIAEDADVFSRLCGQQGGGMHADGQREYGCFAGRQPDFVSGLSCRTVRCRKNERWDSGKGICWSRSEVCNKI